MRAPRSVGANLPFCLIAAKPVLYVANVAEGGFADNPHCSTRCVHPRAEEGPRWCRSAPPSRRKSPIDDDEAYFLADLGLEEPGLDRVIRAGYTLLGLALLHRRVKEVRAWTIHRGDTAPQAAGVIHTDFERGFIRAQTIAYADFVACGGESGTAKGRRENAGRRQDYVVPDGDVMNFLFNV